MMIQLLPPSAPIRAGIRLTGSKSISNRLLILDHLLSGRMTFTNLSRSEDTQLLQKALQQIRSSVDAHIDIHHAGTDMRFLTALLSVVPGTRTLTGSARMKQRPVGGLVDALRKLGASIRYLEQEGFPPLEIKGQPLAGGTLEVDSSQSSQFISALLLSAPAFKNGLELRLTGKTVSYPYIRMTLELLKEFGVRQEASGSIIRIFPSAPRCPASPFAVESDWSSASYWYSICALSPGAGISLEHLGQNSLQADSVLPQLFAPLGVATEYKENGILLRHTGLKTDRFSFDFTSCPDISLTLAVTCFGLGIPAELTGLSTLQLKESKRIDALKAELEKFGAGVSAGFDGLTIAARQPGIKNTKRVTINTHNDHRIAMSFAPLSLIEKLQISDPAVVEKSYPGFWQDLKSAGFSVTLPT